MTKEGQLTLIDAIKTGNRAYINELFFEGECMPLPLMGHDAFTSHDASSRGLIVNWLSIPLEDEENNKALAIHYASKYGQLELVQLFLTIKPNLLNVRVAKNDYTPICYAAINGHVLVVDHLLKQGADLTFICNLDRYGYLSFFGAALREPYLVFQSFIGIRYNKYHLIHLAAHAGQVEVVKGILNHDRTVLNLTTVYGMSPLFFAASMGHEELVEYLIGEDAQLDLQVSGHYGKTALDIAMERRFFQVAKRIILKMISSQNGRMLTRELTTDILDLLVADPEVALSLLQVPEILNLIEMDKHSDEQSIRCYKRTGRRPSWLAEIDRATGNSTLFKPVKSVGRGAAGEVRLFHAQTGQAVCVKSLHRNLQRKKIAVESLQKESMFNRIAYPEDNFSVLFKFNELSGTEEIINDDRLVMPFIKGKTLSSFMCQNPTSFQLAQMILQLIQELHRIHLLGIVHGDINHWNIMIDSDEHNKFTVRIVDFGCANLVTDEATLLNARFFGTATAPELKSGTKNVKPNPNQDVYSLGFVLNIGLETNSSHAELLYKQFPSIASFILKAQSADPLMRPTLESFCCELSDEIKASMDAEVNYLDSILIRHSL